MFKYACEGCGKTFKKKSNYTDHINKKYPCIQKDGIELNNELNYSQMLLETQKGSQKMPKKSAKELKEQKNQEHNVPIINKNQTIIPSENLKRKELFDKKVFICEICSTKFTKKSNLNRHFKNLCSKKIIDTKKPDLTSSEERTSTKININKVSNDFDKLYENSINTVINGLDDKTKLILSVLIKQNNELLKEITTLKNTNHNLLDRIENLERDNLERDNIKNTKIITTNTQINNTLNTSNTTNTTNNNIILAHGKELIDKIELETVMKFLSTIKFNEIIPNMTRHIYVNDDKPQNKNFCVVDLARNKCKFYNGQKWITGKSSDKINKIFDNVHTALLEPFDKENIIKTIEYIKSEPKKFSKKWIDYSKNFLENLYDDDEKENREHVLNELKYIFYNNKNEILKSKK